MPPLATTPQPPYYAVIFTSIRSEGDRGYAAMAERMEALAAESPGFLGIDAARSGTGITVCYWDSLEAIANWRHNLEHREAQQRGKDTWYTAYRVRIARVEREYGAA